MNGYGLPPSFGAPQATPAYNQYFVANYKSFTDLLRKPDAESWRQVAPMGLWTYALSTRGGADPKAVAEIKQLTTAAAQQVVEETAKNGYHVSLLTKDYVWGSNGVAANYGMQLLVANALFAESGVREYCPRQSSLFVWDGIHFRYPG